MRKNENTSNKKIPRITEQEYEEYLMSLKGELPNFTLNNSSQEKENSVIETNKKD